MVSLMLVKFYFSTSGPLNIQLPLSYLWWATFSSFALLWRVASTHGKTKAGVTPGYELSSLPAEIRRFTQNIVS